MTRYQWTVVFAAWLGWGFDVFDGLLFNFVAPLCVPDLLGVPPGDPRVAAATGAITSLLLIGWATGGIVFGLVADRVGRARTLLLTMLLYAVATAACALATNVWTLAALRFIASLGIGGEWAAGASLVAEVVPERRRVMAGALLYTSAPVGIFFAGLVADVLTSRVPALVARPDLAWRAVFLAGLLPASIALWVRRRIREPEAWTRTRGARPRLRELFAPALRRATIGGFLMSLVSLITWWGTNAFLPFVVRHLVGDGATAGGRLGPRDLGEHALQRGRRRRNDGDRRRRAARASGALCALPPRCGDEHLGRVRRRLDAARAAPPAIAGRLRRLWSGRQLQLLPAGALPDATPRHGGRLLLQHRPLLRSRRALPDRPRARRHGDAARGDSLGGGRPARRIVGRSVPRGNGAPTEGEGRVTGLTSAEAAVRLARDGPNVIGVHRRRALALEFLSRFRNPLVLLLLAASGISALTGDVVSFLIIASMVMMSVTLDFVQEHRAGRAAERLKASVAVHATVLRDGATREVPVAEVVPATSCGCRPETSSRPTAASLEARDLFVNQALLTGEAYPVEKHAAGADAGATEGEQAVDTVFMGTSVISGTATVRIDADRARAPRSGRSRRASARSRRRPRSSRGPRTSGC